MASGIREAAGEGVAERKRQLRAEIRGRLKEFGPEVLARASVEVTERLMKDIRWQTAKYILAYSVMGYELDFRSALAEARLAGKIVALPRYDGASQSYCAARLEDESALTRAGFDILEPPASAPCVALNRLDFVLVPGLAFDSWGRRLGRGKGYYDRLLAQTNGIKCGVALDLQIVKELPAEPHDIAMNLILTPTRWLDVPPAGS